MLQIIKFIKPVIYFFLYQALCVVLAFLTMDIIHLLLQQEEDASSSYLWGAIGMLLSDLMIIWHLVHFKYVKFNCESFKEISGRTILYCIPFMVAGQIISIFILDMVDFESSDSFKENMLNMSKNVFGFLSIALLGPVAEEVLCRGFIQERLHRLGWHPAWAICTSAFIFAAIHLNLGQMPHTFLSGLLWGWIYYRTGSLIPGIVGHLINNSFIVCLVLVLLSLPPEELDNIVIDDSLTYVLLGLAIVTFIGMFRFLNKYLPKP